MNLPRRYVSALLTLGTVGTAAPALSQQAYDVALREGLLSIRANDASLLELTEALTEETGVSFVIAGDASQTVTTEILDEGLEQAVAKLSPNYMLVRGGDDAEVTEVVLMLDDASGGGGGEGSFLPSGAPADEVVADDQLMNQQLPNDQVQAGDVPLEQETGFDVNGNAIGADGLPVGPDGLPVGPDGAQLVGPDGLPLDGQQQQ